ncbi:hypothetical protein SEA_VANLEE_85 [Gordonia phage VanLee]|uniref:Uncharacterized protein n=1 Tax=Gordonia phage VanLee TaxID=2845816 RepID=A0A8F2IFI1_9CAUD|nr:hypothetical protein QEH49_gp085 [Gordonia phage VanLee]QWS68202.1 hypothetical protein SEA_VANLEE_85 [Gordonia phage VanLee]
MTLAHIIIPMIMIIQSQAIAFLGPSADSDLEQFLLLMCALAYGSVGGYRLATAAIQRTKP